MGERVATARRARGLTQQGLAAAAELSYATIRAVERGARLPSDDSLAAIAAALAIDPSRLLASGARVTGRVHAAVPAIAAYDVPDDGPVRPLDQLRAAVAEAEGWRLAAQYVRIAETMPPLLEELARAHTAADGQDPAVAALLVSAYRSADAVAYKFGARDLSGRLVELMRWASKGADDDLLTSGVAYVRTEVFFAARAHDPGLRALEAALDAGPPVTDARSAAARGALHMRAAVIAGRAGRTDRADEHLAEARAMADRAPEGVYSGTAFGPDSVRIHELSHAVSLGDAGVPQALAIARKWAPPREMPPERRSGFSIELARAQVWGGHRRDAFESLRVARRIAPQHTREHRWARESAATLLRLGRADDPELVGFAEWIGAV
ncbi:Helix-turn-helix [Actinacidiphila yanglinensis]|uniref:Helix-turn-helix n=2 Tax=Actinacidiphila yanglinensis TaxID=310779 RepID=A0A1H5SIK9_9ACTN|nr:Helix-turn-helix [Actinacidiphila yanglinensis]